MAEKINTAGVPANVLVRGQQCPTDVKEGKVTTEIKDPLGPIKTSPFNELMPATEEWVKKYGGSDISIVAYNVSILFKEKDDAKGKSKDKGKDKGKN